MTLCYRFARCVLQNWTRVLATKAAGSSLFFETSTLLLFDGVALASDPTHLVHPNQYGGIGLDSPREADAGRCWSRRRGRGHSLVVRLCSHLLALWERALSRRLARAPRQHGSDTTKRCPGADNGYVQVSDCRCWRVARGRDAAPSLPSRPQTSPARGKRSTCAGAPIALCSSVVCGRPAVRGCGPAACAAPGPRGGAVRVAPVLWWARGGRGGGPVVQVSLHRQAALLMPTLFSVQSGIQ